MVITMLITIVAKIYPRKRRDLDFLGHKELNLNQ